MNDKMKRIDLKKIDLKRILKNIWLRRVLFLLLLFVLSVLMFSIQWAKRNYGNLKFDEIVFHLNTPLQGVAKGLMQDYIHTSILPSAGIVLAAMLLMYIPFPWPISLNIKVFREEFRFGLFPLRIPYTLVSLFIVGWLGMMVLDAEKSFSMFQYIISQFDQSELFDKEYVNPDAVQLTFPENKRNLICIYLESMESTLMDYENGGMFEDNYIPELTEIARDNISFSQSEELQGAYTTVGSTWTMAALVSETAGVPLKSSVGDGRMIGKDSALSGIVNLGDILKREGYHNYFFAGSDFAFAGRKYYFGQHGDYTIFDLDSAKKEEKIPKDYHVWWGFEDVKLIEYVKEKLLQISQEEEPFNVSLLTVDTHYPSGYVCDECGTQYAQQYANVYACSSRLISEFVSWLKEQDFYDNTTIYICGDHLSMDKGFYTRDSSQKVTEKRRVYNAFVNSAVEPVQQKNRRFTTLDMFPSVLASMGVQIEGERLGLGTNLFSDQETLAERFDYEYLDYELSKKSNYYDKNFMFGVR